MTIKHDKSLAAAAVLASAIFWSGAAMAQKTSVSDAQVQANVLRALANDGKLANEAITPSTAFGTVTLSGAVASDGNRNEAEKIVSHVEGVRKVVDQLGVGASAIEQAHQQQSAGQQALMDDGATQDPNQQQAVSGQNPSYQGQPYQGQQYQGQYAVQQGPNQFDPNQGDLNMQGDPNMQQAPPPQGGRLYRRDYLRQQAQGGDPNMQGSYNGPQGQQQGYGQVQQGYGQQGYGSQGYGQQQGQPGGQTVQVAPGTVLSIRLSHWLSSGRVQPGTGFDGLVTRDVVAGGQVAIPRGAIVQGTVIDVKQPGALAGKGSLTLQLNSLQLAGRTVPLSSDPWTIDGRDKVGQTVGTTAVTAIFGTLIGAAAGGGPGAAIGAVAGGAAGLGISAAERGGNAVIPGEAVVDFRLNQPTSVVTVSEAEMQRLGGYAGPQRADGPRPYPGASYGGGYGAPYGPYGYGYPVVGVGLGYGYPYRYRGYYGPRYYRRY